jgi:anti-sigma factor RsiW
MSDEFDPGLARLFREASQPLSDAGFHARLMARMKKQRGLAAIVTSATRALLSGLAIGVAAPFRLRPVYVGMLAACGVALMIWETLQST